MNTDILTKAGIDYEKGTERFYGNAMIYESILAKFPSDTTFARAKEAHEEGNLEQLLKDVHELKGVSGNMEMTNLYKNAADLVLLLKTQSYTEEEVNASFAKLENEYHIVCEAIASAKQ